MGYTPQSKESIQFRQKSLGTWESKNGIVHVLRIRSQTGCCAVCFVDIPMKSVRGYEAIFLPVEWRSLAFPSYFQLHLTHLMSYNDYFFYLWPRGDLSSFLLLIFKWTIFISFSDFVNWLFFFVCLVSLYTLFGLYCRVVSLPHISLS